MLSGDSRIRTEGGLVGFRRKRTRTRKRKWWTHVQIPSTPRRADKWSAALLEPESGLQREIRVVFYLSKPAHHQKPASNYKGTPS